MHVAGNDMQLNQDMLKDTENNQIGRASKTIAMILRGNDSSVSV